MTPLPDALTTRIPARSRRRRLLLAAIAAGAVAVTAPIADGQTGSVQTAPAGVFCAGPNTGQYGYGPGYAPSYGPGIPSYGIGSGAATGTGNPGRVKLTRNQLLINQRISQAAIRRTNAIEAWLDGGVVGEDICGGALGPEDFSGVTPRLDGPRVNPAPPKPRPLKIASQSAGNPGGVTLSRGQLLINQRISQAAVRRANGLRVRLVSGLTGGDVRDGALGNNTLRIGFRIAAVTPVPNPAPATVTVIVTGTPGNPAGVTLSRRQLLINQRISQAAVRRANAIIAHLRTGLNGNDFRDGSITGADVFPAAVGS